jgi:hypothetical protein
MTNEQEGVPLLVISRDNAEHYFWGTGCDGWHLVRESGLSVIEECMPARVLPKQLTTIENPASVSLFSRGRLSWKLMAGGSLYSRPRLADPAWQTSPFLQ